MTASSPRPAAPDTTGELPEESVDLTPGVVWTDAQLAVVRDLAARTHRAEGALQAAHVAAPDTTGGELRTALAEALEERFSYATQYATVIIDWDEEAEAIAESPALRDLLAERDTLAAQVRAVEGLAATWERRAASYAAVDDRDKVTDLRQRATALRRALGTPTTGGGE